MNMKENNKTYLLVKAIIFLIISVISIIIIYNTELTGTIIILIISSYYFVMNLLYYIFVIIKNIKTTNYNNDINHIVTSSDEKKIKKDDLFIKTIISLIIHIVCSLIVINNEIPFLEQGIILLSLFYMSIPMTIIYFLRFILALSVLKRKNIRSEKNERKNN